MLRLLTPIIFGVYFVGWFSYRAFVTKDIRSHLNELGFAVFFLAVWLLIYWVIFS